MANIRINEFSHLTGTFLSVILHVIIFFLNQFYQGLDGKVMLMLTSVFIFVMTHVVRPETFDRRLF